MSHGIKTIIVIVKDLAGATKLYRTALGVGVDESYLVGSSPLAGNHTKTSRTSAPTGWRPSSKTPTATASGSPSRTERDCHGHDHVLDFPCARRPESQTTPTRPTSSGVTMTGSSTQGIKTVLHPASDLEAAKAVYAALLGLAPQTDGSYYVGFEAAGQHIGLVPGGGPQGMTCPVAYWHVPDIETKLAEVTAAGATVKEPAHDVGDGRLVATVTDPDGNVLGLLQDR
jgi:predicted enzyme related to lactoylglutathione lyase